MILIVSLDRITLLTSLTLIIVAAGVLSASLKLRDRGQHAGMIQDVAEFSAKGPQHPTA